MACCCVFFSYLCRLENVSGELCLLANLIFLRTRISFQCFLINKIKNVLPGIDFIVHWLRPLKISKLSNPGYPSATVVTVNVSPEPYSPMQ